MSKIIVAILRSDEVHFTANLFESLFWCSMALTFLCEVAAVTILTAVSTNSIQDESEVWTAVWFFTVTGGVMWIVGHTGDREGGHTSAGRSCSNG